MATPTILVPLDGSKFAEDALDEAARLARAFGARVILLQVLAQPDEVIQSGSMRIAIDEIFAAEKHRVSTYLNEVASRALWRGVTTSVAVEAGNPAEAILDFARSHDVDHIVMTTRGRSGITRWVFGSVAEKVLHAADRTLVLVRPRTTRPGAADEK